MAFGKRTRSDMPRRQCWWNCVRDSAGNEVRRYGKREVQLPASIPRTVRVAPSGESYEVTAGLTRRLLSTLLIDLFHGSEKNVCPYSLPSVGPGAVAGVQAVSPQVTRPSTRQVATTFCQACSYFVAFTRRRHPYSTR